MNFQSTKDRREILLEFSKENKEKYSNPSTSFERYLHIKNINKLLKNAKQILKEFLPTDDMLVNYENRSKYHLKGDEQQKRIFSFNYLRQVVNDNPKKFNKIKFPERAMIIKHNGKLLT